MMENLKDFTNEKLCEIVVMHRYLGIEKDRALACMIELSSRRTNGDEFDYETCIEKMLKDLPKISIDLKNLFKIPTNQLK